MAPAYGLILSAFLSGVSIAQQPGGKLPDILGGNIPALQNPNRPLSDADAMSSPGTGPYPAHYFADDSLFNHTIYAPKVLPKGGKTPILLWGNGGCVAAGTASTPFLLQVASQGP
jgi:hypothetical protein